MSKESSSTYLVELLTSISKQAPIMGSVVEVKLSSTYSDLKCCLRFLCRFCVHLANKTIIIKHIVVY